MVELENREKMINIENETKNKIIKYLDTCGRNVGLTLEFQYKNNNLPVLVDNNGKRIALYEIIGALGENIDYTIVAKMYPKLPISDLYAIMDLFYEISTFGEDTLNLTEKDIQEIRNAYNERHNISHVYKDLK